MKRRRAVKLRGKSAGNDRWFGRSLFLLALLVSLSIGEIVYGSGIYKKIDFGQHLITIRQFLEQGQPVTAKDETKSDLSPQQQSTIFAQLPASRSQADPEKDDLGLTRVQESKALGFPKPIETDDSKLAFDNPPTAENTPDGFNPADAPGQQAETAGSRSQPILQKDAVSGLLSIGNFKTLNVSGSQHSCSEFAGTMLKDIGASPDKLSVEMNNAQISIYKICASNGSVVITCRNGKIVVSPRQLRPDDQCVRAK